jgi:hypothetical protein
VSIKGSITDEEIPTAYIYVVKFNSGHNEIEYMTVGVHHSFSSMALRENNLMKIIVLEQIVYNFL